MTITIRPVDAVDVDTSEVTEDDRLILRLTDADGETRRLILKPEVGNWGVYWYLDPAFSLWVLPKGWAKECARALLRGLFDGEEMRERLYAHWLEMGKPEDHLDGMIAEAAKNQLLCVHDGPDHRNIGAAPGQKISLIFPTQIGIERPDGDRLTVRGIAFNGSKLPLEQFTVAGMTACTVVDAEWTHSYGGL